jgi:hypothetical protein
MTQQADAFAQQLIDAPALRAEFQRAPEEAAARFGLDLSATDVKALRSIDWGDDQLVARLSRRGVIGTCTLSDANQKENVVAVAWGG